MSAAGRRGFTIVELLVVITIITLLLAILQPNLRTARASAQRAICGSNARQLGIAFTNYADDHRRFPGVGGGGFSRSLTAPWVDCQPGHHFNGFSADPTRGVLFRYVPDPAAYRCPVDDGRNPNYPTAPPQTISYALPWFWEFRKTEDVRRPSELILLIELGHSRSVMGNKPDDGLYYPNMLIHDTPTDRHPYQSATAVMGDTHVDWREWDAFSPLANSYYVLPAE